MLDVHIADSFDAATQSIPVCGFSYKVHELLFCGKSVAIEQFPFVMRMSDFFDDTKYRSEELSQLIGEIESLIAFLPPGNEMVTTLERFREACNHAKLKGQNVYLMCD